MEASSLIGPMHMHDQFQPPEVVRLPDTSAGCRQRIAELQDEIASIRIQIATTDIRRQAEKKTLDASWYHRAKTALRVKQQELGLVSAQLSSLNHGNRRERFKDALIEVLRADCDDEEWASLISRARALEESEQRHG